MLPPGQLRIAWFPSFGVRTGPPPTVPKDPTIAIGGAGLQAFLWPVSLLASLPRVDLTTDLHCVSGWTATGLRWSGVRFAEFYRSVIAPALPAEARVTHLVFEGLDRYRSILALEDVLSPDVLLTDQLDDQPLSVSHGAPVRVVSPNQYGFNSTKHLAAIELHSQEPPTVYHPNQGIQMILRLVRPHPHARVWGEECHRYLPGWAVRPVYHALAKLLLRRHKMR